MSRQTFAIAAAALVSLSGARSAAALERGFAFAAAAVVAQADAPADDAARRQMNDLLSRARQAMAEGQMETADSLISRAEGLNVTLSMFHMGDSPKKARRDWLRLTEVKAAQPTSAVDPFAASAATATPGAATAPPAAPLPSASPYPSTAAPADSLSPFARPTNSPPVPGGMRPAAGAEVATQGGTTTELPSFAPQTRTEPQVLPLPAPSNPGEIRLVGAIEPINEAAPPQAPLPPAGDARAATLQLVQRARAALAAGNVAEAEQLAGQADALGVPDDAFGPQDDRAWLVLMEIEKLRRRGVAVPASAVPPATFPGVQAVYDPASDSTRNVPASTVQPTVGGEMPQPQVLPAGGPVGAQPAAALEPIGPGRNELLDQAAKSQDLQARQLMSDVAKLESQVEQVQLNDPAQAHALLEQARVLVEKSSASTQTKQILLRRIERNRADLDQFIETNRPRIELAEQNREVKAALDREQVAKLDGQQRLASLVEEYNMLIDQQRFSEAEVLAKRASEIAPDDAIVVQLQAQSKALRRMFNNADLRNRMEEGVASVLGGSIPEAAIPMDDRTPYQLPRNWIDITNKRGPLNTDTARRSPKELEIEQKLRIPVSLKFDKVPFSEAFNKLSAMTGVPFYLDQRGLAAEGVDSSTPISIDLSSEISLKSALNIMLSEHHLTYVIKDEVLKITSDRMRSEDVYTITYPVGDLVIPIPNFSPSNRMGLAGALADAQGAIMNGGALGLASHAPISVVAQHGAGIDSSVMGQVNVPFVGGGGGPPATGQPQNFGFGPGGMGGGVNADFDSLIDLITSTIRQQDWQDNGGTIGFIRPHETTLSLVITHDVRGHEEISNLLTQLRKLQDLQVTIEVRFITLNDAFYEQVGIDFDIDIDDNSDVPYQVFGRPNPAIPTTYSGPAGQTKGAGDPPRDFQDRDHGPTTTVGLAGPGIYSQDLDIPINNTSLAQVGSAITTAVPAATLVNGLAAGGASVGFAILSDLEAYFFINAVQDDQRSNILQAPKVTMFNGQQAFVSDTQQVPFVVSVVPVVGDFAAAQQPVIVVLNEGTSLSVQAVVSNDRRFVRMTMVPFFSQIGEVNEFTFEGSESSTVSTSSATTAVGDEEEADEETVTRSGTTVQLPTFAFQTVTTTVSVPDGGTVLLGGIKRMREARSEDGIPMVSKIPYLNRLFTNVAVAKSSQSLMMMVTPRIIIQEEEEAAIGITSTP